MKKYWLWLIGGILIVAAQDVCLGRAAITFELNGGRLGDNLRSFSQACWLAYKHDLDLYVTPFTHFKHFALHDMYPHRDNQIEQMYSRKKILNKRESFPKEVDDTCLYCSTYYCNAAIDWSDTVFCNLIKQCIAPNSKAWHYMSLPEDKRTVAIHVRRGGGYHIDNDSCRRRRPYQFPSLIYYARSLQVLLDLYPDDSFFVHIFTDDQKPHLLIKAIQDLISAQDNERIAFSWRVEGNNHANNVVEDFFDMSCFDCLIRPVSNLSVFVERIGNHELVIIPKKVARGNPWGKVSSIELHRKNDDGTIKREQIAISVS